MAVSASLALMALAQPAAPLVASGEGTACLTGFCSLPVEGGMPGGLMYLAIGLVWLGVAGLRQGRRPPAGSGPGSSG
jgi:hypothetical protein